MFWVGHSSQKVQPGTFTSHLKTLANYDFHAHVKLLECWSNIAELYLVNTNISSSGRYMRSLDITWSVEALKIFVLQIEVFKNQMYYRILILYYANACFIEFQYRPELPQLMFQYN